MLLWRKFRFLFRPRWIAFFTALCLFAVACVLLSAWQFGRRNEKLHEIAQIDANFSKPPAPIKNILLSEQDAPGDNEWRPATARGKYVQDAQVLVRTRAREGNPGFEILTPLRLDGGGVFVVNRGWLPTGRKGDYPDFVPPVPQGTVNVRVYLRKGERKLGIRSAPNGQVASIYLPDVLQRFDCGKDTPCYTSTYGLLAEESPPSPAGLPFIRPMPTEGNHFGYAIQWILFAAMAIVGFVLVLRQELQSARDEGIRKRSTPTPRSAAPKRNKQASGNRKPRKRDSSEVLEDMEIDAFFESEDGRNR